MHTQSETHTHTTSTTTATTTATTTTTSTKYCCCCFLICIQFSVVAAPSYFFYWLNCVGYVVFGLFPDGDESTVVIKIKNVWPLNGMEVV